MGKVTSKTKARNLKAVAQMVTAMIEATLLSLAEGRPVKIAEVLG